MKAIGTTLKATEATRAIIQATATANIGDLEDGATIAAHGQ